MVAWLDFGGCGFGFEWLILLVVDLWIDVVVLFGFSSGALVGFVWLTA